MPKSHIIVHGSHGSSGMKSLENISHSEKNIVTPLLCLIIRRFVVCFEKLILNRYVQCKNNNGFHRFLAFYTILQYLS
jgi:hypothetical protein